MARTIFHGPKGVRAIEVRLYVQNDGKTHLVTFPFRKYFRVALELRDHNTDWTLWLNGYSQCACLIYLT